MRTEVLDTGVDGITEMAFLTCKKGKLMRGKLITGRKVEADLRAVLLR